MIYPSIFPLKYLIELKVKEWLQSFGVIDHAAVVEDEDEPDDGAIPLHHEESTRTR